MRAKVFLYLLGAVGLAAAVMGCERSQPAESPSSCGCAVKQGEQRQAPAPKLSRPSPVPSHAGSAVSVGTVSSAGLGKEDKKDKKKKGLFKW